MKAIGYVLVLITLAACNRYSRAESKTPSANPSPDVRTSREREVPSDMKEKLIDQAVTVARESGRSVEGLNVTVSEWRESWQVWFTPKNRREAGGSGFVVEIYKDGKKPPRILKGQ